MYLLVSNCRWRLGHVLLWTLQDLRRKLARHSLVRRLAMGKLVVLRSMHMRLRLHRSMLLDRSRNGLRAGLRAHHGLHLI